MVRPFISDKEQMRIDSELENRKSEYVNRRGKLSSDMEAVFEPVRVPSKVELINQNSTNPLLTDSEYGFLKELFSQDKYVLLTDLTYSGSYYQGAYGKTSLIKKNLITRNMVTEKDSSIDGEKKLFRFNLYNIGGLLYEIYTRSDWDFLKDKLDLICVNPYASELYRKFGKITSDLHSNPIFVSLQFPLFFAKFLLRPDGFVEFFSNRINIVNVVGALGDREFLQMFYLTTFGRFDKQIDFAGVFNGKKGKKIHNYTALLRNGSLAKNKNKPNNYEKRLSLMVQLLERKNAVAPSTSSQYVVRKESNQDEPFSQLGVIGDINCSKEVLDYEI